MVHDATLIELLVAFELLIYLLMGWWALKAIIKMLIFNHVMNARRRRGEQFVAWCQKRANGTWWERENGLRHWRRIVEEGPNSDFRGPWEEEG